MKDFCHLLEAYRALCASVDFFCCPEAYRALYASLIDFCHHLEAYTALCNSLVLLLTNYHLIGDVVSIILANFTWNKISWCPLLDWVSIGAKVNF